MIDIKYIDEQIREKEAQLRKCHNVINKISLIRLLVFLAFLIFSITCIVYFDFIVLSIAIASLISFIAIIKIHDKKYQSVNYYQNYLLVLKEYKARHSYEWHKFKDKGEVSDSCLSSDIDLLGDHSLYQYLSVCKTNNAKAKLSHLLINGLSSQEEINNKLDEMAESGQLTDIIAQYLGLAGMIAFDTVADMKLAENLVNGSKCHTLGFYSVGDNGSALYKVRPVTNEDVVDESSINFF